MNGFERDFTIELKNIEGLMEIKQNSIYVRIYPPTLPNTTHSPPSRIPPPPHPPEYHIIHFSTVKLRY